MLHNSELLCRVAIYTDEVKRTETLGAGLEPASNRFRADRSTTELPVLYSTSLL